MLSTDRYCIGQWGAGMTDNYEVFGWGLIPDPTWLV